MRTFLRLGSASLFTSLALAVGCSSADDGSSFLAEGTDSGAASSSTSSSSSSGSFGIGTRVTAEPGPVDAAVTVNAAIPVCGDGVIGGTEACDDGNTSPDDGCSASCGVEADYVCLHPGKPCALVGTCGDGRLKNGETCDDGDGLSNDGCSASCQVEPGWICPLLGASCLAAACGDGVTAGDEACDDGDTNDTNGCSNSCKVKDGFKCEGTVCTPTICGDATREGTEQCDDGNKLPFDGCSQVCTKEPVCPKSGGACAGACGDGIIFPGEECDDGNLKAGDGCSATCKLEPGFVCAAVQEALPDTLDVPIVLRDFSRGDKLAIAGAGCTVAAGCPSGHPDFQTINGGKTGMVGKLYNDADTANIGTLDADGKPVLTCTAGLDACKATSVTSFRQWYRDLPGDANTTRVNHTFVDKLTLALLGKGTADPRYEFESTAFFPLTGMGFGNQWNGTEGGGDRNFHFTSELRFWFYYDANAPAPRFDFRGDDDVWVYVNGKLAVDIGGVHGATDGNLVLDGTAAGKLGMTTGNVYEFALFQAERRRSASNYKVTFRGFVRAKTNCAAVCGDGVKTKTEACDDGTQNDTNVLPASPAYGKCSSDCKSRGPYCGDGTRQATSEVCDDGVFNGGYGKCNADCTAAGPKCGDGRVQAEYGEVCDEGSANDPGVTPAYGKCASDCRTLPRCGDGIVQAPEACEPPNTATCSATCSATATGPR